MTDLYIGTAGWGIPHEAKKKFSAKGSHLERYSKKLNCAEINSSFYKEHKFETYLKWASLVPADFRFSVKLFKYFTHERRLLEGGAKLRDNLKNILGLKEKFAVLVVQLPPSLTFNYTVAKKFFLQLKKFCPCQIVVEPRNISWASSQAIDLLQQLNIGKILADPEPCKISKSMRSQVEKNIRYYRLHGSPEIYKSNYDNKAIHRIKAVLDKPIVSTQQTWVIFDNSMYGFATENALQLTEKTRKSYA